MLAGLFGFINPDFIGLRLSTIHSLLFLVSGLGAIYFGLFASQTQGRAFCVVFGAFYGLLGLAGFLVGGLNSAITSIPESLVLGTMDHVMHVVLGAVFLTVGWLSEPGRAQLLLDAPNKS